MSKYNKVLIVLKDSDSHATINSRIIDYLNDRHYILNDNRLVVALTIADEANINDFVSSGVKSLPAMKAPDADYVYGANSIIAQLAQLEHAPEAQPQQPVSRFTAVRGVEENANVFHDMIVQEMMSEEQEDEGTPSSVRGKGQDFAEDAMSEKELTEKAQEYSKIWDARKKNGEKFSGKAGGKGAPRAKAAPTANPGRAGNSSRLSLDDISSHIENDTEFDATEKMLLQQLLDSPI